jgi:serine/threonine protein kinase
MSKGHNHAVDYWSLGVLIYIMLTGKSPFYRADISQMAMFKKIVLVEYEMHASIDTLAADLIKKLLVRKVPERLGNLKHGHHDVNEHRWFLDNDCHYKKLLQKAVEVPWKPKIQNPFDASNFDDFNSSMSEERRFPLSVNEQKVFVGF